MDSSQLSEQSLLLEMYRIQVLRSEHYEKLRASISSLLFLVAASLVGFVASGNIETQGGTKLVGSIIIFVGLFGFMASAMHAQRASRHGKVAPAYREVLKQRYPSFKEANELIPRERTHLNMLWSLLHFSISGVGIVIVAMDFQ